MPSAKNWVNFFYVNIALTIYIVGIFFYSNVAEIKAKWPLYRYNQMYMYLADNMEEKFVYFIQYMQTNFMVYILQSFTIITNSIAYMMYNFINVINYIISMFSKIIQPDFGDINLAST
jgi:hypothetical protein